MTTPSEPMPGRSYAAILNDIEEARKYLGEMGLAFVKAATASPTGTTDDDEDRLLEDV